MKNQQLLSILFVAMTLATAWAIRGQFGHEQGAAWAGVLGAISLVLVSKREDWYNKIALIALASAVGWGAGGMISYGVVVGYGRADDFINVFYGLSMLFVIGALYGLLGGGLVGLTLDSTSKNKVKWGSLISEMVAGALLTYYFLIEQIGFKMTPPRSEAWAFVLGSGLALLWYMAREKRYSAIRVAFFSAMGAGFGFGFGNFLHVLGNVWEINFNMWNVMEYSIGFFGGSGMAYGVFSSVWPESDTTPEKWENRISLFFVVVFIPLIVFRESLTKEHLINRLGNIPNLESVASLSNILVIIALLVMMLVVCWKLKDVELKRNDIFLFFILYFVVYTFLSYIVTGLFAGKTELNHYLYVLNIVLIFIMYRANISATFTSALNTVKVNKWFVLLFTIIFVLVILSLIAISTHGEIPGSHTRFPIS